MLEYEDLLPEASNQYLNSQTKILQENVGKLDMGNQGDKWLAVNYIYGLNNGLKDYQARSFASELTLFLTGKIYSTDVGFVYREDWLDSYFYEEFEKISRKYPEKNKGFWNEFIQFLLGFYKSSLSWHYERVSKYLQFRINESEREMFDMIPMSKPKERFIYLLEHYPFDVEEVEIQRESGDLDRTFSINLTRGEYDRFMQVSGSTKTQKFLNLLYYWHSHRGVTGD